MHLQACAEQKENQQNELKIRTKRENRWAMLFICTYVRLGYEWSTLESSTYDKQTNVEKAQIFVCDFCDACYILHTLKDFIYTHLH